MVARIAVFIFVLAVVPAPAGKFKHGLGSSDKVFLQIPHPPDALIKAKNLNIQWESTAVPFGRAEQLKLLVQQALAKEFSFTDQNPDAVVKLSVLGYEPIRTRTYTQTETRSVKVGEKTTYDKNGKPHKQDVFDNRQVPIGYWEASGALNINVAVVDKKGTPIDSFAPSGRCLQKQAISVNNESTLGRKSLPSAESLEGLMYADISGKVQKRYTASVDPVEVMLAVDDELRPANKLAQTRRWAEALEGWKAAKLKNNPGDQTFNIAVAKEAMAYAEYARSQSLDDMMPLFKEAMDLYEQALKQDPGEKYMQNQVQRLTLARTNIDNVRKHYEDQEAEARKAAEEVQKMLAKKAEEERRKLELEAAIKDTGPDSAEEAKFRPMARMRLAAMQGDITEQQTNDLIGLGQRAFGVNEMKSTRVVLQEVERRKKLVQKLKDYDDMFAPLVKDGKLSVAARSSMRELQKNLGLEETEVQPIEAKYTFVDEAKQVQAAKAVATTESAKKAPAGAKKTAAAAKKADSTGTTKPATTQPGIKK